MSRISIVTLVIGISVGVLCSYVIIRPAEPDYDKLVSIIRSELNILKQSPASQQLPEISPRTELNQSIPAATFENKLSIRDLKNIFRDVAKELLAEQNTAQDQNNYPKAEILSKKILTPEQQEQQKIVWDQANFYLDEAITRGSWSNTDMDKFNDMVSTLPESELFEIYRQFSAAINEGKIKPDPDVMLF